jgi:hypothetical protein
MVIALVGAVMKFDCKIGQQLPADPPWRVL